MVLVGVEQRHRIEFHTDMPDGTELKTVEINRASFAVSRADSTASPMTPEWAHSISRTHARLLWRWDKGLHCVVFQATHVGGTATRTEGQPAGPNSTEVKLYGRGKASPLVKLSVTEHTSSQRQLGSTSFDQQYQDLLRKILRDGDKLNTTRGPCLGISGYQLEVKL